MHMASSGAKPIRLVSSLHSVHSDHHPVCLTVTAGVCCFCLQSVIFTLAKYIMFHLATEALQPMGCAACKAFLLCTGVPGQGTTQPGCDQAMPCQVSHCGGQAESAT